MVRFLAPVAMKGSAHLPSIPDPKAQSVRCEWECRYLGVPSWCRALTREPRSKNPRGRAIRSVYIDNDSGVEEGMVSKCSGYRVEFTGDNNNINCDRFGFQVIVCKSSLGRLTGAKFRVSTE